MKKNIISKMLLWLRSIPLTDKISFKRSISLKLIALFIIVTYKLRN